MIFLYISITIKEEDTDLDCQQLVSGITGEEKISDADLFTYRVCLTLYEW